MKNPTCRTNKPPSLGFMGKLTWCISRKYGVSSSQPRYPTRTISDGPSRVRWSGGPTSIGAGSRKGSILIIKSSTSGLPSNSILTTALPSICLPTSASHCLQPTSAHLEELHWQEEIWESTIVNATYVEVIKQAKNKEVSNPAQDCREPHSNISTFCA